MAFIYPLQKLWFTMLHGEITGDTTDMTEEVMRYISVYNFTVVRRSVGAKEEAEPFIMKFACTFPPTYALYSH